MFAEVCAREKNSFHKVLGLYSDFPHLVFHCYCNVQGKILDMEHILGIARGDKRLI